MRIEFLNVWSGKTGPAIESHITKRAKYTDVFCFQEADGNFPTIVQPILFRDFNLFTAYKRVDDNDIFPQATYVRRSLTVKEVGVIMQDTPNTGLGLSCEIVGKKSPVYIANIHGISRPGDKLDTPARLIQSQNIINYFIPEDGQVIIGGDFNLGNRTRSQQLFSEMGYTDLINIFQIPTTRNRYIWDKYPDSKQYYSDYVFIRQCEKLQQFKVNQILVSDHNPMVIVTKD